MPEKYRQRPVTIEAVQWRGMNHEEVKAFLGLDYIGKLRRQGGSKIIVRTREGQLFAPIGWWLIRGVNGEHYPCDPDVFDATFGAEGVRGDSLVEGLCGVMHDAYEAAAAQAGWETQERSRKPWVAVPEANKVTMRAAVSALLDALSFMGWVNPDDHRAEVERGDRLEAMCDRLAERLADLPDRWRTEGRGVMFNRAKDDMTVEGRVHKWITGALVDPVRDQGASR